MQKEQPEIWTIAQLTRRVKNLLEGQVGTVWIAGEISNWKLAASGHAYFTLKDATSQIDAVIFRGRLSRLKFRPESGLEVIARGQITVYERRGNYQIILEEMQPKGMGALQLAFERLKAKLQAEGVFDEAHKKALPLMPRRIGVVTSPTGAAIRDILQVLNRRFANVHVVLCPARVQGDEAAAEIVEAIETLDQWGVDVMIVGRGGGSLEDLWPFNEEPVVRAVFAAKTPIISAVGHEIDFALTDFAADLRAPTPSAAAELVVREQQALTEQLHTIQRRLSEALSRKLERAQHRLQVAQTSFVFTRPEELVRQRRQTSDELRMRLEGALQDRAQQTRLRWERCNGKLQMHSPQHRLHLAQQRQKTLQEHLEKIGNRLTESRRQQLAAMGAHLNALSPLAILSRGYTVAWKMPEKKLVKRATQLQVGDKLSLRFGEGAVNATVNGMEDSLEE